MARKRQSKVPAAQYGSLGKMHRDLLVTMQAAWIEWKRGNGANAAMEWIENTLIGPGMIPAETDPYGKEAQAFFDANRADPLPACPCGRPSYIGWMGRGFCSNEHYSEAKKRSLQ